MQNGQVANNKKTKEFIKNLMDKKKNVTVTTAAAAADATAAADTAAATAMDTQADGEGMKRVCGKCGKEGKKNFSANQWKKPMESNDSRVCKECSDKTTE